MKVLMMFFLFFRGREASREGLIRLAFPRSSSLSQTHPIPLYHSNITNQKTKRNRIGLWGDMVVTLNNGDKVELRSVPRFQEMKAHILSRRDALVGKAAA